jgi:hypothetical protein
MRKIYLTIIGAAACVMSSCSGMLDSIQPYLDEGETIYAGKMDNIIAFTGKNKVKLAGLTVYGVNQTRCVISWRNPASLTEEQREFELVRPTSPISEAGSLGELMYADSLTAETIGALVGSLDSIAWVFDVDGLEEGQHEFSIVLFDPQGNSSIPSLVSAYIYGEQYEASLLNREIRGITALPASGGNPATARIRWVISSGEQLLGSQLTYELADGRSSDPIDVQVADTATNLEGYRRGGWCAYTSIYRPNLLSLDEFTSACDTIKLPQ